MTSTPSTSSSTGSMRSRIKFTGVMLVLIIWFVAGIIISLAVTGIYNPSGPGMGVAFSPARDAYAYLLTVLVILPPCGICMYLFSRRQDFIAPVGRYVPGRKYKVWSSWTLAACAVTAALYAGTGFISGISNVDLPALATAIMASYFGPIVAFVGIIIGALIRGALGGLSFLAPTVWIPFAVMDALKWVLAGTLIYFIVRGRGRGVMTVPLWIVIVPVILVEWLFLTAVNIFTQGPAEYFAGFFFGFFIPVVLPTSVASIIVGLAAAEAAYAATKRGRRGPVVTPKT